MASRVCLSISLTSTRDGSSLSSFSYHQNHCFKSVPRNNFFPGVVVLPRASISTHKPQQNSHGAHDDDPFQEILCWSKRRLNLSVLLALFINGSFQDMPNIALANEFELQRYTDSKEGFTLLTPSSYVKVDKAGATVLFEEGSNNIGVVVSPVRLSSLREFGSPQFVADKLIQAERRKSLRLEVSRIS
uniref:PsbP C-terminal domain-containing protein n=1 Tax=Rhizophora mucronata TaxID=61149 RepID=A0A2P2JQK6_RHIMU